MALRQKIWIDRSVQGVLIERTIIYWLLAIVFLSASILCDQWWRNPDWSFGQHVIEFFELVWPWTPSVFLLLPLILFDVVRLSHQFVGPVFRLRRHLFALQKDIATYPLSFRDSDYWQELVGPVNWLQAQLLQRDEKIKALEFILQSQTTMAERSAGGEQVSEHDLTRNWDDDVAEKEIAASA